MDDYKKKVIEMVKNQPLLWDPQDQDYKNKDQRKQAWETIDAKIRPPYALLHFLCTGYNTNAKDAWDRVQRGYCNVLKKREAKSSRAATSTTSTTTTRERMGWKFAKDLEFLLPVKRTRPPLGFLSQHPPENGETANDGDTESFQSDTEPESFLIEVDTDGSQPPPPEEEEDTEEMVVKDFKACEVVRKQKRRKQSSSSAGGGGVVALIRQWQKEKDKETPRFLFMKSLMPMVEELSTEDFMDFQVNVIQDLRRKRSAHQPGAHGQPLPGPSACKPSPRSPSPLGAYNTAYTPASNTHPGDRF